MHRYDKAYYIIVYTLESTYRLFKLKHWTLKHWNY